MVCFHEGRKISLEQREKLYEFLRIHDVSKPVGEKEYDDICKDFKKGRIWRSIKEKWADHYGEPWPTYQSEYFNRHGIGNNDKLWKNYDMHHIIPKRYGGPNEWWNIIPAGNPEEHQKGIHQSVSYRRLFPKG